MVLTNAVVEKGKKPLQRAQNSRKRAELVDRKPLLDEIKAHGKERHAVQAYEKMISKLDRCAHRVSLRYPVGTPSSISRLPTFPLLLSRKCAGKRAIHGEILTGVGGLVVLI